MCNILQLLTFTWHIRCKNLNLATGVVFFLAYLHPVEMLRKIYKKQMYFQAYTIELYTRMIANIHLNISFNCKYKENHNENMSLHKNS